MCFDLGYTEDELDQTSTEHTPASVGTSRLNPVHPTVAGDSLAVGEPVPAHTPSRIRFIEPIIVPSRPPQVTSPHFDCSPAPATPTPLDPQPAQDTTSIEGMFENHLVVRWS